MLEQGVRCRRRDEPLKSTVVCLQNEHKYSSTAEVHGAIRHQLEMSRGLNIESEQNSFKKGST